jgi:hypothetical protein
MKHLMPLILPVILTVQLMCAMHAPAFRVLCFGDTQTGLQKLAFLTEQDDIRIKSIRAYDPDGNLVMEYENPNADVAVFGALHTGPGAVEVGKVHRFVVDTNKGMVRFKATPVLAGEGNEEME